MPMVKQSLTKRFKGVTNGVLVHPLNTLFDHLFHQGQEFGGWVDFMVFKGLFDFVHSTIIAKKEGQLKSKIIDPSCP